MNRLPERISPMFSTRGDAPPEGEDWLHELGFGGYRMLCRIEGEELSLLARGRQDWTDRLLPIADSLRDIAAYSAWLDGELVFSETEGLPCFGSLLSAVRRRRHYCLSYWVSDLLFRDGADLRELPLLVRKQLLAEVLPSARNLHLVDHILGHGKEVFAGACSMRAVQVVSKRAMSVYSAGRSAEWVTLACPQHDRRTSEPESA